MIEEKTCDACHWWVTELAYSFIGTCKCPKPWWAKGNPEQWDDSGEGCPTFRGKEDQID